jgi:hypothetical protein
MPSLKWDSVPRDTMAFKPTKCITKKKSKK